MSNLVAKSIFTVIVLALSIVAVKWNRQGPVFQQTEKKILAGGAVSAENTLPVTLTTQSEKVVLGQEQVLTISTSPKAKVALTVIYANGTEKDRQVISGAADQAGYIYQTIKTDDWRLLGPVRIIVVATDNAGVGEVSKSYELVADDQVPVVDEPSYNYPLLP